MFLLLLPIGIYRFLFSIADQDVKDCIAHYFGFSMKTREWVILQL